MSNVELALEYRARGLCPLPLAPRSKKPHVELLRRVHGDAGWKAFRDRPPSPPEIREWHELDPKLNLAVATGGASDGLIVADLDRADAGVRHPVTPSVRTSRG